MSRLRIQHLLLAAAYLGAAGCVTTPNEDRVQIIGVPLVSTYADIAFTITSGSRLRTPCYQTTRCMLPADREAALRLARQVEWIADALQKAAQDLYPALATAPSLTTKRFDVYVVVSAEPGSRSSADGRIALNSALSAWQAHDASLAFVIAREMGHVIAHHAEENSGAGLATSMILNIVLPGSGLVKSALSAGGSELAAGSKRRIQAQEADAIAFSLLTAAGFRLHEVSDALGSAPVILNDGIWSQNFRRSSASLLAADLLATEHGVAFAAARAQ